MSEMMLNQCDLKLLSELKIDVIDKNRNYWFIRTRGGNYFYDFIKGSYVGIEWDQISDKELIKEENYDNMLVDVVTNYPNIDKPGYVVNQILNFAHKMRKGDIVLIPSENSDWIGFGEILENEMYIYDEEDSDFEDILDRFYNNSESQDEYQIIKKRRKVKWIDMYKKNDLDPYLYRIIYSHGAISNANKYSIYIDRTLSKFYIKGDKGYFTYTINRKNNIHYCDILKFLNNNYELMELINRYIGDNEEIDINEIVLKINVQSKGPVQLKGKLRTVLIIGLVIGGLFGTKTEFKVGTLDCKVETSGLSGVISTVNTIINYKNDSTKEQSIKKIIENYEKDKKKLELQTPFDDKCCKLKDDCSIYMIEENTNDVKQLPPAKNDK